MNAPDGPAAARASCRSSTRRPDSARESPRCWACVRDLPGVESAAAAMNAPYGTSSWTSSIDVGGRSFDYGANEATDSFRDTMQLMVTRGRWFDRTDDGDARGGCRHQRAPGARVVRTRGSRGAHDHAGSAQNAGGPAPAGHADCRRHPRLPQGRRIRACRQLRVLPEQPRRVLHRHRVPALAARAGPAGIGRRRSRRRWSRACSRARPSGRSAPSRSRVARSTVLRSYAPSDRGLDARRRVPARSW